MRNKKCTDVSSNLKIFLDQVCLHLLTLAHVLMYTILYVNGPP